MIVEEQNLHIDAPQLLTRSRRIGDALLTGLMWAFYSYLWTPVISLLAWLLGFEFAYNVLIRAGGLETLKDVVFLYGSMVALIFLIVAGWSITNRRRFAHRNRRKTIRNTTDEEITAYFGLASEQLVALRESRIVRVSLGDDGDIQSVEPRLIRVDGESVRLVRPQTAVAENEPCQDDDKPGRVIHRSG